MIPFLPSGGYPEDELAPPVPCAACRALEEKGKTCWRHKPIPAEEATTLTIGTPYTASPDDYVIFIDGKGNASFRKR